MSHALVTFLGRTPKKTGGYQTTTYHLPDGSESEPTALLGWILATRLKPDRLVVLGTPGSMWDFLAEQADIADSDGDSDINLWGALEDAVSNACVTGELLSKLEPLVSKHLEIETCLRLIPNGFTEAEQLEVLQVMADSTCGCAEITLEVSHGFRHLPMIAVVAANYLQAVRDVEVRALWYGFYDPDTKRGTVSDLKGLLHLFDWVRALSQFEHSGDYGVFAELLASGGRNDLCTPMREAALFERTTQDGRATHGTNTVISALGRTSLDGVASLFQPALEDRLTWRRSNVRYLRQRALACIYLERRDYLRATIYALESFISCLVCEESGNKASYDYGARQKAKEAYEKNEVTDTYNLLRGIRNTMTHGTMSDRDDVKRIMKDECALRQAILKFLETVPDRPISSSQAYGGCAGTGTGNGKLAESPESDRDT